MLTHLLRGQILLVDAVLTTVRRAIAERGGRAIGARRGRLGACRGRIEEGAGQLAHGERWPRVRRPARLIEEGVELVAAVLTLVDDAGA